jgi:hypothetical protein
MRIGIRTDADHSQFEQAVTRRLAFFLLRAESLDHLCTIVQRSEDERSGRAAARPLFVQPSACPAPLGTGSPSRRSTSRRRIREDVAGESCAGQLVDFVVGSVLRPVQQDSRAIARPSSVIGVTSAIRSSMFHCRRSVDVMHVWDAGPPRRA